MKLVDQNVGPITNVEVVKVLERRGANRQWSRKKTLPSEKKVYGYLIQHNPTPLTREQLQAFFDALESFNLTRGEKLQIANNRPVALVDLYLIVEDCESRLSAAQQQEVIAIVQKHLTGSEPTA